MTQLGLVTVGPDPAAWSWPAQLGLALPSHRGALLSFSRVRVHPGERGVGLQASAAVLAALGLHITVQTKVDL